MNLILNAGSTSLKYTLFESKREISRGCLSDIGKKLPDHLSALKQLNKDLAAYSDKISTIGHRVVHGGKEFRRPVLLNDKVIEGIAAYNDAAPLHNPIALEVIAAARDIFPGIKNYAVFDTGLYENMPRTAKNYALPRSLCYKYNIERLGFHGLSHEYALGKACADLGMEPAKSRVITCHLGGGSSVTAFQNGLPVDTSTGFTPLEGLIMMTRSGDVDPGVILYLMRHEKLSPEQMEKILYDESGVEALAETDLNMKDLLISEKEGNLKAKAAIEDYIYRIVKYIGAYAAVLDGVDIIAFTGSIGARSARIRDSVISNLNYLGQIKYSHFETDEELIINSKILNFNDRV